MNYSLFADDDEEELELEPPLLDPADLLSAEEAGLLSVPDEEESADFAVLDPPLPA